jgi:hypothetical protein
MLPRKVPEPVLVSRGWPPATHAAAHRESPRAHLRPCSRTAERACHLRGDHLRALPDGQRLTRHAPRKLQRRLPLARQLGGATHAHRNSLLLVAGVPVDPCRARVRALDGRDQRLHRANRSAAHGVEGRGLALRGNVADDQPGDGPAHFARADGGEQKRELFEPAPHPAPLRYRARTDADALATPVCERPEAQGLVCSRFDEASGQSPEHRAHMRSPRLELAQSYIRLAPAKRSQTAKRETSPTTQRPAAALSRNHPAAVGPGSRPDLERPGPHARTPCKDLMSDLWDQLEHMRRKYENQSQMPDGRRFFEASPAPSGCHFRRTRALLLLMATSPCGRRDNERPSRAVRAYAQSGVRARACRVRGARWGSPRSDPPGRAPRAIAADAGARSHRARMKFVLGEGNLFF